MTASLNSYYTLILVFICQVWTAPLSSSNSHDPVCASPKLITSGRESLVYQYRTEVKLSVANGQYDLQNEITANVHIKSLGDCNYAIQLRNIKVTETKDEDETSVTSTARAQRELENLVVRFRWIDGFLVSVEADSSANIDHVNFVKGVLSALQVYPFVLDDDKNIVREEDVLGVCTTFYKYSQKSDGMQINKIKDLSTCSRDKLHLSSSPVLTSLLGPLMKEVFTAKTRYVCQTNIRNEKIQTVKCKTIEVETDDDQNLARKNSNNAEDDFKPVRSDDISSEDFDVDFDYDDDYEEISSKLLSIKQELTLQTDGSVSVNENAVRNPVQQSLQFVPTPSFDQSNEAVSTVVSKIQALLKTEDWDQFASANFVDITNELRRMDKDSLEEFQRKSQLKHLIPTFLNKIYAHDPAGSLLNFDINTLKFVNPLSVYYLDKPSTELVEKVVQGAGRLNAQQVPEFVGVAARILQTYKARQDNNKDADAKIRQFHTAISKFLSNPSEANTKVVIAVLSAYAQLGLFDNQVQRLAADDRTSLPVQYHALNAIRHICDDYIDDNNQLKIRADLQNILLRKIQNQANKNAVRIWAFDALFTPFIYNPEDGESALGDNLEKSLSDIVNQPLNQVNGYIWSALKYISLDSLSSLRGIAARVRAHHDNRKQFFEQATLSSRQIQIELPLSRDYRAVVHLSVVFENNRVVPSFLAAKLAFDGIRHETLRLPWVDAALISENLDWNFAEYFLRLDPLNDGDTDTTRIKNKLPPNLRRLQNTYDGKDEDPDPSVHLHLKLFGTDIRSNDVTDKVTDILRTNLRTFIRNKILNRLKDLTGKNPVFGIPLEIGAAVPAANGLTLHRSAQLGIVADLNTDLKIVPSSSEVTTFSITSRSSLSFSVTLQREVSSPLTTVGETVHIGTLSNVPFKYSAEKSYQGQTHEFNLLNSNSKLFAIDFRHALRTSQGFEMLPNRQLTSIDPSCTPSFLYRILGIRECLELNPFRSLQIGSRPLYPISITISKDPSIQKWRIGWRFNAQNTPQYEVAFEKVGVTGTYPGMGMSAQMTGNQFDIRVLTGMKSFNVKGTKTGDKFSGSVYSNDNKEVMAASGKLIVDSNKFDLESTFYDISSKRTVGSLKAEILANSGKGLKVRIDFKTSNKPGDFKINFHGDLYKPNYKLLHIDGSFSLGDTTYSGKAHAERDDDHTLIEIHRSMKLSKSSSPSGYDFFYERKNNKQANQNNYDIVSHLTSRKPTSDQPMKIFNLQADFTRAHDLTNATLDGSFDFVILTRDPPVAERIQVDYVRQSVRKCNEARCLIPPEANLKLQIKTKTDVFNFRLDHRHRANSDASRKGNVMFPPTLDIDNKIHINLDTDKLFPDIPRRYAFDVLSDLDFELLNKVDYKFQYDLPHRQRSGSLTYQSQIHKVTHNHLFFGTSKSEVEWDNKKKRATAKGNFEICIQSRSIKTHWDINTNLHQDKDDMELDLNIRLARQTTGNSPKSFIGIYNVSLKAPKHSSFQLFDLDGNLTKQRGRFETFNSIAYRVNKKLKEINLNAMVDRNQTGDGSIQTHVAVSLPFRYLPYITHDIKLRRAQPAGSVNHIEAKLIAKPVFAHHVDVDIDRVQENQPPRVHVRNQIEYLRANGDNLFFLSKVDVHRWSTLHSFGLLKRNTDLLHKHSIGYIFSTKTRKVALSFNNPQLSGNPLSIIGELTIDRENRIGKMKWPQEFGVHLEFATPISKLSGLRVFYNLPSFNKPNSRLMDGSFGFKLASPKIEPIGIYFKSEGSLDTTLNVAESVHIGNDIAVNSLLTAQYNPRLRSQISLSTSSKYYGKEYQHSLYALFKKHEATIRGILNAKNNQIYNYEMDIGYDDDLLTGNTLRTNGKQTTTSEIDAKRCSATGRFYRCYKGYITVRSSHNNIERRGTFDASWGRGTVKLNIDVPNHIDFTFDHTHTGSLRDDEFNSRTKINAQSLESGQGSSFTYSGSSERVDGKWNHFQMQSSLVDSKTGQKFLATDFRLNRKITNKRLGQFKRDINFNFEHGGRSVIDWSSEAVSCPNNPSNVVYGICQTAKFNMKASNELARRFRQRFKLPDDPRLSNSDGYVTYDGTSKLDIKHDLRLGPHKAELDINRFNQKAVNLDLTYQPRVNNRPMNLDLRLKLLRQNPISIKYQETVRSTTNFHSIIRYSFNANDNSAEKTYQCSVDRQDVNDISINCQGERTKLTIDIDRRAGRSKAYVDLNRYPGQRIGYEGVLNPGTKELDATLYTLVTSWNIKRQPGRSTTVSVKQNNQEVFRIAGRKNNDCEITVKFSPANIHLKLDYDNSTLITLTQTYPQQRNLAKITIDRARIRRYGLSLRNRNRPSLDIDEPLSTSQRPIFEIAFDSYTFVSLSQALKKAGAHNGLYGLDTIKKLFKLQIGDVPYTVYNIQHWKTHREDFELPESYSLSLVNDVTGNVLQLVTTRWNEHRLISRFSHSFDGGKILTTDLKLDRDYAHQVGSVYFFHSLGYRNGQGLKQFRNASRHFIETNLKNKLKQTNVAGLLKSFQRRMRSILEKDYAALKEIATAWSREPETSFYRRISTRLELPEFFRKYPTYSQASDGAIAVLRERATERRKFWQTRIEAIFIDNRLKDASKRFQERRTRLIQYLLDRSEKVLDLLLPKVDHPAIEKRIANYVQKILAGFQRVSKRNTELWKAIFRAIDDASKGDNNKWFRILVADIDSNAFAAAADAESAKLFKKLDGSSKLFINNLQQLSRRFYKRREAIRERVKNAIRHIPKAYINGTNFEFLFPVGREPGSYVGDSELALSIGSLIRNPDQAADTIRSVLKNKFQSRSETSKNYMKAFGALAKRLLKRKPSLTHEFNAIIAQTGDAINVHGEYIYLNPACNYVLAHDFGDLKFSFRFTNGTIYSLIPYPVEIKKYECSNTGRVQICNQGYYSNLNVPMYYGGRVDGALGDVRDRSAKGRKNLAQWLLEHCPAVRQDPLGSDGNSIPQCIRANKNEQKFCEKFIQRGMRQGLNQQRLLVDVMQVSKYRW